MEKRVTVCGREFVVRPLGVRRFPALVRLQATLTKVGESEITDQEWDDAIRTVCGSVDGLTPELVDELTFKGFVTLLGEVLSAAREEASQAAAPFATTEG